MATFLTRRLLASLLVLFAASFVVYLLAANSGDPLEELRSSNARNKEQLIAAKVRSLDLDVPPVLRYFLWLGGILRIFVGSFSLGEAVNGQQVTSLLGAAMGSTLQLVTGATLIAIVVGVGIGITTALRQYTSYDYGVTFISFLFFSLPIFWLAVMLKQYLAIGFNDFLENPEIPPAVIVVISVVSGVVWLAIIGGELKRRIITLLLAASSTALVLTFLSVTRWFSTPVMGPVVIAALGLGIAYLVTVLSTGIANRKSLYTALSVVGVLLALYFPLQGAFQYATAPLIAGIVIAIIGIGVLTGYLWGGPDRWQSARTGGITALLVGGLILVDRFLQSWKIYSDYLNGRPIATISSQTPDLEGSFWVLGLDSFTHLLLPTAALLLASLAGYTRYSRASLLDVLNQDYIRTARAKGLTERTVVMRHAFRNALIPITTIIAFDFGAVIGGAIITERVFGWSGMGALFNNALGATDVNSMMGVFLVTGIAVIVFNLVADLVYSALDPRIRVTA